MRISNYMILVFWFLSCLLILTSSALNCRKTPFNPKCMGIYAKRGDPGFGRPYPVEDDVVTRRDIETLRRSNPVTEYLMRAARQLEESEFDDSNNRLLDREDELYKR